MGLSDARYYFWGFAMNYTEVRRHFLKPELDHWETNFVTARATRDVKHRESCQRSSQVVFCRSSRLVDDFQDKCPEKKSRANGGAQPPHLRHVSPRAPAHH